MRNLLCIFFCLTLNNSFSQSFYETGLTEPPLTSFRSEDFIDISGYKCINSTFNGATFCIKRGALKLNVSGVWDNVPYPNITTNVFAKNLVDNDMIVIASSNNKDVEYKIEGDGAGIYGGAITKDNSYILNTGFKLVSPGHPTYFLLLPLRINVSRAGNNNLIHSFIDSTVYVYYAEKNKKMTRRTQKTLLSRRS